jgi:hypothetical protein
MRSVRFFTVASLYRKNKTTIKNGNNNNIKERKTMNALRKIQTENETKNCEYCESEFTFKRRDKKYCSSTCKAKAHIQRKDFIPPILNEFEIGIEPKFTSHLRIVRDELFDAEQRVSQFWLFCHATLWNNQQFSKIEVLEFKKLICQHFMKFNDLDTAFKELIERVCLAKRYVTRRPGRYIAKPIDWLNINYRNGLSGTESWYKSVTDQRKTVPKYNEGILILSRAVLNYCERRNILDCQSYRRELIRLKQFDMLQIYMNTIVHVSVFKAA